MGEVANTTNLYAPLSIRAASAASGWSTEAMIELAREGLIERLELDGEWTVSVLETAVSRALRSVVELTGATPSDRACAHLAAGVRHALLVGDEGALLLWPGGLSMSQGSGLEAQIHSGEAHIVIAPERVLGRVVEHVRRS